MRAPIALHSIPEKPGVYLMKDSCGTILYVGKAKNLFLRVKTYFSGEGGDGRPQIPFLLERVHDVETYVVASEKEALLLEAKLIQQYRPPYNILLKEDSSEVRLHIDTKHDFPSIQIVRLHQEERIPENSFGPFLNVHQASILFDLLVRFFRLRQCSDEEFARRTRPCLLYQLNRCTAPCVRYISHEEYHAAVMSAISLLQRKDSSLQQRLKKEMEEASERLDFERASLVHKQRTALQEALEKLHQGKKKGVSDSDVVALFQSGSSSCLCVMHYRHSLLVSLHSLTFELPHGQKTVELDPLLIQYYGTHALEKLPKELLLAESLVDIEATREALSHICNRSLKIECPQKGAKKALVRLAEENAQLRLLQKKSHADSLNEILDDMQRLLDLERTPMTIDCFDVSHLSGKECVAACVAFKEGKPNKKMYRCFRITSQAKQDDCSMMQQAIERRYRSIREEDRLPDLVLVDGGELQLKAARDALAKMDCIGVQVCSLSKEASRHDKGLTSEKIWIEGRDFPVVLDRTSPVLHLLQRIRDEAHRFSITYQKKRRVKALFASQLDDIPHIGPVKKRRLLQAFAGIEAIRHATPRDLIERANLSESDAERVLHALGH